MFLLMVRYSTGVKFLRFPSIEKLNDCRNKLSFLDIESSFAGKYGR